MTVPGLGGMGIQVPASQPSKPKPAPSSKPSSPKPTGGTSSSTPASGGSSSASGGTVAWSGGVSHVISETGTITKPLPSTTKYIPPSSSTPSTPSKVIQTASDLMEQPLGKKVVYLEKQPTKIIDITKDGGTWDSKSRIATASEMAVFSTAQKEARYYSPETPIDLRPKKGLAADMHKIQQEVNRFQKADDALAAEKDNIDLTNRAAVDIFNAKIEAHQLEADRLNKNVDYYNALAVQAKKTQLPRPQVTAKTGDPLSPERLLEAGASGDISEFAAYKLTELTGETQDPKLKLWIRQKQLEEEGVKLQQRRDKLMAGKPTEKQLDQYYADYTAWTLKVNVLNANIEATPDVSLEPPTLGRAISTGIQWGFTGMATGGVIGTTAGGAGTLLGMGTGFAGGAAAGLFYAYGKPAVHAIIPKEGIFLDLSGMKDMYTSTYLGSRSGQPISEMELLSLSRYPEKTIPITRGIATELVMLPAAMTVAAGTSRWLTEKALQWKGGKVTFKSESQLTKTKQGLYDLKTEGLADVEFFKKYPPVKFKSDTLVSVKRFDPTKMTTHERYAAFLKEHPQSLTTQFKTPKIPTLDISDDLLRTYTSERAGGLWITEGMGKGFKPLDVTTVSQIQKLSFKPISYDVYPGWDFKIYSGTGQFGSVHTQPGLAFGKGKFTQDVYMFTTPDEMFGTIYTDIPSSKIMDSKFKLDVKGLDIAQYYDDVLLTQPIFQPPPHGKIPLPLGGGATKITHGVPPGATSKLLYTSSLKPFPISKPSGLMTGGVAPKPAGVTASIYGGYPSVTMQPPGGATSLVGVSKVTTHALTQMPTSAIDIAGVTFKSILDVHTKAVPGLIIEPQLGIELDMDYLAATRVIQPITPAAPSKIALGQAQVTYTTEGWMSAQTNIPDMGQAASVSPATITEPTITPIIIPGGGVTPLPPEPVKPVPITPLVPMDMPEIYDEKKKKKKKAMLKLKKTKGFKTRMKLKFQSAFYPKVVFGHRDLPMTKETVKIFRREKRLGGLMAQVPTLEMFKESKRKRGIQL